jgi:2-phosphosulfolactate phosphatase
MVEDALVEALSQKGAGVRFDWGPTAAEVLARGPGAVVVVDVLSFTTAVSVATGRGTAVIPYPLAGEGAAELATRLEADLAVPRRERSPDHPWTLSPPTLASAPETPRLVLPSPNGSAIAALVAHRQVTEHDDAGTRGQAVLAGCLRNVTATVGWLLAGAYGTEERPVWLVASGERWPDGSLRPALEDQLGAGAVADALEREGRALSVEAQAVARTYRATSDLLAAIEGSSSGRELVTMGFADEPGFAATLDADAHASVMADGMFVRA